MGKLTISNQQKFCGIKKTEIKTLTISTTWSPSVELQETLDCNSVNPVSNDAVEGKDLTLFHRKHFKIQKWFKREKLIKMSVYIWLHSFQLGFSEAQF